MRYRFRAALLVACAMLLLLVVNSSFFSRWAYPVYYEGEIQQAAQRYELDPYLIAAVVRTESRFKEESLSAKGAIGLMQLMPETAAWALEEMGFAPSAISYVNDPALNIEVGTWYLAWLLERYQGNLAASLAAYNAGQGKVDEWQRQGVWDLQLGTLADIPFPETRRYVRQVLDTYQRYRDVYVER